MTALVHTCIPECNAVQHAHSVPPKSGPGDGRWRGHLLFIHREADLSVESDSKVTLLVAGQSSPCGSESVTPAFA